MHVLVLTSFCIFNYSFSGKLIAIIGQVASGKSALLQAIMGFLKKESGEASVYGRIAYAAQHAWVQNVSFRENILFGKEYDEYKVFL